MDSVESNGKIVVPHQDRCTCCWLPHTSESDYKLNPESPNELTDTIRELVFGTSYHEELRMEWSRKLMRAKRLSLKVPHWRTGLKGQDKYALVPIWYDLKYDTSHTNGHYPDSDTDPSRVKCMLWNPLRLEDCIYNSPKVINALIQSQLKGYSNQGMTDLIRELQTLFFGQFKRLTEQEHPGSLKRWSDASRWFCDWGVKIVAEWLMADYTRDIMFWMETISRVPGTDTSMFELRQKKDGLNYQFVSTVNPSIAKSTHVQEKEKTGPTKPAGAAKPGPTGSGYKYK